MIQENRIQKNSHNLRNRRIFAIPGFFLVFEIFAADTDRHNPICAQADDWAERLLKSHATIAEVSRPSRGLKPYRLKHKRNSTGRTHMVDGKLCRQGHSPA